MSNFAAESHSLPTFKERLAASKGKCGTSKERWLTADKVVTEVYVDLCNGLTKSEVLEKLMGGMYESQKNPVKIRTAQDYVAAAYQRMHYDFEAKAEEMRADLYNKLISVYADAVKSNDRYNAIQAVNTIMKLTGCAMDKPQNNIQLNATSSGVTINFGFSNKEEEENVDDQL